MPTPLGDHYLTNALVEFRRYKQLAERAMDQIGDEVFFAVLDPEANSIAVLVKHMAGNMRSRWRDFLTTDGEKADRDRDSEFIIAPEDTRAALLARWEEGWQLLFDALEPLMGTDLLRTVSIRGEPHTIVEATNRQVAHYAYHVGQIVFLAKHARSREWQSLSIPRGQSEQFNAAMGVSSPDDAAPL